MRVGAIPPLRIKDLEPIEKYNIYKITVYANQKDRLIELIVLLNAKLQLINIYHGVAGGVTNFMKTNLFLDKTSILLLQQQKNSKEK